MLTIRDYVEAFCFAVAVTLASTVAAAAILLLSAWTVWLVVH